MENIFLGFLILGIIFCLLSAAACLVWAFEKLFPRKLPQATRWTESERDYMKRLQEEFDEAGRRG